MQSLDAAVMPPPPSLPQPQFSSPQYPILTLDHQQNFFTGWSSGPDSQSQNQNQNLNLKTPSLGLVWTNQIACRIALVKEQQIYGNSGEGNNVEGSADWTPRQWKRYMKVVFASWAAATGSEERGTEFEIWSGGLRAVGQGSD